MKKDRTLWNDGTKTVVASLLSILMGVIFGGVLLFVVVDGDQEIRVQVDLPGNDGLLLVAAGHAAHRGHRPLSGADVKPVDEVLRVGADGLPLDEAPLLESGVHVPLEHQIVLQGEVQHQPVLVPVLGDVALPGRST